jgi:D-threo-aldose 1-dehydrogenase
MKTPLTPDGPFVGAIGVGTSALGSMPETYGYEVEEAQAIATIVRVLESPLTFLDTSNEYGGGESERRIERAIRPAGGLPDDFVIATKADPERGGTSFTGQRVHESFRESAERLGVERFGVYYLHDPERFEYEVMVGPGGAVEAMAELKRDGMADAIGVAGGDIALMYRYVDSGVFDVVLNHNRYTLLDRSADGLIDHAVAAGVSFVNAAPYASGMLAKPAEAEPRYQYGQPSRRVVDTTARLRELCAQHGVSLAAVALQFSVRDQRIASTVVGVSTPERVDELIVNESAEIPAELWVQVSELLDLDTSRLSVAGDGSP